MTKAKAIKEFCYGCAGDSPKEVTLCHIFDCTLWEYRTGSHVSSTSYQRRIEAAFKNYKKEFNELAREGVDLAIFRAPCAAGSCSARKRGSARGKGKGRGETGYGPEGGLFEADRRG
jgi:hypothetical protein